MNFRFKPPSEKFNGFLDYGTSFTGELSFEGTFRIDGEFHGSIVTKDVLVVGPRATIYADIQAGEAKIHGSVFGNICGLRRIEIGSTGKVQGDLRSPHLAIEEGAVFEGRSFATTELAQAEASAAAEESAVHSPPEPARQEPRNDGSTLHNDATSAEQALPRKPAEGNGSEKKRWAKEIL